ncbi:MAG: NADH-quinone oxidoreductase subunit N, partial [Candidatus Adiutrix sp.]|nr:NADH-quinone oxidoreductase subunit N [Candidatus Adiutrix sp.]
MTTAMNFDILSLLPELAFFLLAMSLFAGTLFAEKYPAVPEAILAALPLLTGALAAVAAGSLAARGVMFWGCYKIDALSQLFKL